MRLKYSNQLSSIWSKYHETKYLYESIMESSKNDPETLKLYEKVEKKKYDKAIFVFPTINLLRNLTSSWYLRTIYTDSVVLKEEMLEVLNIMKKDLENIIISMQDLFNIEGRIKKGEDPSRVQQIKSVRKSIQELKKQIEALEWYEDIIKNTNIIEEKTLKMMEEDNARNNKKNA